MTQLLELRGVVEAPPDAVAGLLLDVRPGGRSPIAAGGDAEDDGGDRLVVVRDGSRLTVTIDRGAREVTEQSEWWFRSTTAVEADPRGSLVVHRIFNVADGNGRAIRFLARGPVNAAPQRFAEALRRLGEELGVAAWLL
ncbi:hypothetical protein ACIA5C_27300 [Actinoplanes sp. NPDC051343]|jgi:hypothetical protein|uniref:hypothetical protein n=1 Tax=Actinoplanes sp. NPDC051343 TaxID=3363906 RepID=UPI0037A25555